MAMDAMWFDYDKTHVQGNAQMTAFLAHKWQDWSMDHFKGQEESLV